MTDAQKKKLVEEYYFNVSNPGAFSRPLKMFRLVNKKYPGQFTLYYVRKWLNNQDLLQIKVWHRFKTPNVRVISIDEQFDVEQI